MGARRLGESDSESVDSQYSPKGGGLPCKILSQPQLDEGTRYGVVTPQVARAV